MQQNENKVFTIEGGVLRLRYWLVTRWRKVMRSDQWSIPVGLRYFQETAEKSFRSNAGVWCHKIGKGVTILQVIRDYFLWTPSVIVLGLSWQIVQRNKFAFLSMISLLLVFQELQISPQQPTSLLVTCSSLFGPFKFDGSTFMLLIFLFWVIQCGVEKYRSQRQLSWLISFITRKWDIDALNDSTKGKIWIFVSIFLQRQILKIDESFAR